jgi:hypothetical protein
MYLHHAVSIGVVMDCTSFARAPDEDQLIESANLAFHYRYLQVEVLSRPYQVALSISFVDQIPCVCSTGITQRK